MSVSYTQGLFIKLINELKDLRSEALTLDAARYYSILITDMEKVLSVYEKYCMKEKPSE